MRENPLDPEPRVQAAEFHAGHGDPQRAAALFAEVRRLAGDDRGRELYATQRLIDLYIGPLAQTGSAIVEMRRLVERFPGSREAESARDVIGRLKSEASGLTAEPP